MERKLVKDVSYEGGSYTEYGMSKAYCDMNVKYQDGTYLELIIDITNGPDDYIEQGEWYAMVANTRDELELTQEIRKRLQNLLDHNWSDKEVYYHLNNEKVILSEIK